MTTRRNFLKFMGAGTATVISWEHLATAFAATPQPNFYPAAFAARDSVHHIVNRLTFGPTTDLLDTVRKNGVEAFIEDQLNANAADNSPLEAWQDFFVDLSSDAGAILQKYEGPGAGVQGVSRQLIGSWVLRAMYSPHQLYEHMVQFWTDHFSIFLNDGILVALKVDDEREVIRPHALGNFRDLLGASAHSPAMLVYLDNALSDKSAPNENYARELLELHSMGIDGGYTELDVQEVARAFTGWTITRPRRTQDGRITFQFVAAMHDEEAKTFLGQLLAANGGVMDGEQVLDIVASHPATAQFISTKLVRRFVADDPPAAITAACAATFLATNGDIKAVLRTLFSHDEFWNAPPKFKRPFEYTISVLRAMNYQVEDIDRLVMAFIGAMHTLGHIPHQRSTPDGYPDTQADWIDNLLMRWNIAIAAAHGGVAGAQGSLRPVLEAYQIPLEATPILNFMSQQLYGRTLTEAESQILANFLTQATDDPTEDLQDALALLMAAPAFQYR